MKKFLFVILISLLFVLPQQLFSDDIKGYMIPEFYYVGAQNDADLKSQNGFWVRRIYFGYNTKLGDGWSARVRFEMNSPAFSEDKMYPYIKNAHLQKKFKSGLKLTIGMIEPPSFNLIEKQWGYRYIEKTAPDFFKLASSRDIGISLEKQEKSGLIYTVMFGNYGSNKGEDNKGKAIYGRLGIIKKTLHLEVNGHYAADGSKDIIYLAGFGGFKGDWGRLGAGVYYKNENPEEGDSKDVTVLSAHATINFSKKAEIFARVDSFFNEGLKDPGGYVPILAKGEKPTFIIAGLNFKIHKMIQLSPNVKFVMYANDELSSDFYVNLTAKVSFKTGIGGK